MFQDKNKAKNLDACGQQVLGGFSDILTPELIKEAAKAAGLALGNTVLSLCTMVALALVCAIKHTTAFCKILNAIYEVIDDQERPNSRLARDRRKFLDQQDSQGKDRDRRPTKGKKGKGKGKGTGRGKGNHHPSGSDPFKISDVTFLTIAKYLPPLFWFHLALLMARKFEKAHPQQVFWKGYRLLAVDGTIIDLESRPKLSAYYGTSKNQKGAAKVQLRMVMIHFPLCRVPLVYKISPLSQGENTIFSELIRNLGPNDLILMDAGFWSYGLFNQIKNRGAYFVVRKRNGVKFHNSRPISKGSDADCLVAWTPKDSRGEWKGMGYPKTMTLREIRYEKNGFRPSAIVTNVLEPGKISTDEMLEMASSDEGYRLLPPLYRLRWEIETAFRELKVVQKMEGNLRGRTPATIEFEIAAHMLFYTLIRWRMVQAAEQVNAYGRELSFTRGLEKMRDSWANMTASSLNWVEKVLVPRIVIQISQERVWVRPDRSFNRKNRKNKSKGSKDSNAKKNSTPSDSPHSIPLTQPPPRALSA